MTDYVRVTVAAGTRSDPVFVAAGAQITAQEGTGATCTVEYTQDGRAAVLNNRATWLPWLGGRSQVTAQAIYIRATSIGGSSVIAVDEVAPQTSTSTPDFKVGLVPAMRPSTYCLFGDSIMARNTFIDPTNWAFLSHGCVNWFMNRAGWPLTFLNNGARSGATTEEMLLTLDAGVIAYSPGYCFYNGGWNDIARNIPTRRIIANLQQIATRMLNANILPIYQGMHSSTNYSTLSSKNTINTINREMREFHERFGGIFIDTYSATLDTATGGALANMTLDGLHFTTNGARIIGETVYYPALSSLFPPYRPICSSNDWSIPHANPLMLGNNASGTNGFTRNTFLSGNGPDGWTADVTGTTTGTLTNPAARTDGRAGQTCVINATIGSRNNTGFFTHSIRWGTAWTAGQALTRASWRVPTVSNGFMYNISVGGTTGATEPAWPTEEGATVVDNTATWRAFRIPRAGEIWTAEFEYSGCSVTSGSGMPAPILQMADSVGTTIATAYGNFIDPGDAAEVYPLALNATYTFRTPNFTIPTNCVWLITSLRIQGDAGAVLVGGVNGVRLFRVG